MKAPFFLIASLSLLCFSCKAATPVPGLAFPDSDGRRLEVFADDPDTATRLSADGRTSVALSFSPAFGSSGTSDIILDLSSDGAFRINIYGSAKDKSPTASFSVDMRFPGILHVPCTGKVAVMEIALAGAKSLILNSLGSGARFTGYRVAFPTSPLPHLSADCVLQYGGNNVITQVAMPLSGVPALGSVVAQSLADGKIGFQAGSVSWDMSVLAALPAALPLELFPARELLVASGAGLSQAYYDTGDGAPLSDLHALLSCAMPSGEYSLWRWDLLPRTLVFDFRDYATQDLYLKRLAFFAEKPGFVGRLAKDSEIAALHGWNAHDYPASTLLAFYSLAKKEGFALNDQELALYSLLVKYSILVEGQDGMPALGGGALGGGAQGGGAMISVCRESDKNLRRLFIDHESSHALFFYDSKYRELAASLWDSLDPETRRFWKIHFEYRRYDPSNRYLMVNELQAYLVQQSTGRVVAYYGENVIPQLAKAFPQSAKWLSDNAEAICADSLQRAARLDAYLLKNWGLRAGSFGRARVR